MQQINAVQVKAGHYKKRKYNTIERFISYFYQVDAVSSLDGVHSVLEIGPGSKLVSRELEHLGFEVTTCDFDAALNPDFVADVRSLPFEPGSYDCVMACQILEHIPYLDFEKVLGDLARITRRYTVISLPERHVGINAVLKFPFIQTLFKRKFFDISFRLPVRFKGFKASNQHYFEIDGGEFTKKRVRESFKKHFRIIKEFNPPLNKFHHFFILEKH